MEPNRELVIDALSRAGCVAPAEEADELLRAAGSDAALLESFLARRTEGEPLAWITGIAEFCGLHIHVDPGVYVPRPHTEILAKRAVTLLPENGIAVDLCTGSGAVAAVMRTLRSGATVLATDVDPLAVACAKRNGVEALLGDLDEPLPSSLTGTVDVLTAVPPYVPSEELHLLPRDVVSYEPTHALDGGPGGTETLQRIASLATRWLRPGGVLLLELGGDQARELTETLTAAGFTRIEVHRDTDGQDRAIEAWLPGLSPRRDTS